MKILFFITSLRSGGAERVASTLCNYWADNDQQVILATLDTKQHDFYTCSKNIKRYEFNSYVTKNNLVDKLTKNLLRFIRLRQLIKTQKPDLVVSFLPVPNLLAITACLFTKTPVIISERCFPPYFNHNYILDCTRKIIYKFSKALVVQTKQIAIWGETFLNRQKIAIIVNPLDNATVKYTAGTKRDNIIFAIGRLEAQKGFDLLIAAFNQLQLANPDWRLKIAGTGTELNNLWQQISDLGLTAKVQLLGQVDSPEEYYATAKIFVLSSRAEGFPNVLVEAMANGLPVVSFDCATGPAEIISHEVNGLLVPAGHVDELAIAVQRLMQDQNLREKLANAASKVRDKYTIDQISAQWLQLFKQVVGT